MVRCRSQKPSAPAAEILRVRAREAAGFSFRDEIDRFRLFLLIFPGFFLFSKDDSPSCKYFLIQLFNIPLLIFSEFETSSVDSCLFKTLFTILKLLAF